MALLCAVGCGRSGLSEHEVSRCWPNCPVVVPQVEPLFVEVTSAPNLAGLVATDDGTLVTLGDAGTTVDGAAPVFAIAGTTTAAPAGPRAAFLVARSTSGNATIATYAGTDATLEIFALTVAGNTVVSCGNLSGSVRFDGTTASSPTAYQAPLLTVHDSALNLQDVRVLPTSVQNGQCKALSARDGRLAITGLFGGTLDPGGGLLTASIDPNAFVALYGASGLVPQWQRGLLAPNQVFAEIIELELDGGVIAGGRFAGSVDFGPPALVSQGSFDGYLIRYTAAGAYDWSLTVAGTGDEFITRSTTSSDGVCFCGHTTSGALSVGTEPIATSGQEVFVGCVDGRGVVRWADVLGTDNDADCSAMLETVDGTLFIGGSVIGRGGYVAAYDQTGVLQGLHAYDDGSTINGLAEHEGVWVLGSFTDHITIDGVAHASAASHTIFMAPVDFP